MDTVLVLRLSAMGDVAMTIPILHAFEEQYPNTRLIILSRETYLPFYKGLKRAEIVLADRYINSGLWGLYKLAQELKQYGPFHLADLHNVLRTKVLGFLLNKQSIKQAQFSKNRKSKKALTRKQNRRSTPLKTVFSLQEEVFQSIGYPLKLQHKLKAYLTTNGDKKNAIGFATGAKHLQKKLAHPNAIEAIKKILSQSDKDIYLFGTKEEQSQDFINLNQKRVLPTHQLSLEKQLELMGSLDCMLSMDSSNAHLASLCGVENITIWCATQATAGFRAYGQVEKNDVSLNLDCSPCSIYGTKECWRGDLACTKIPAENIVSKLKPFL